MADIRIDLKTELLNGQSVVFQAPCDCTEITGMVAYYHDGSAVKNKRFAFKDSHGNNLAGLGNLFTKGAYVKVILDTVNDSAFIQNADTNSYLEKFDIQTSNDYELRDSKAGVLKLNELVGNTEQKTMSGKNLFGGIDLANAIVNNNTTSSMDTTNKTVTLPNTGWVSGNELYSDFKENTQYTFIFYGSNKTNGTINIYVKFTDGTDKNLDLSDLVNGNTHLVYVSPVGKTVDFIRGFNGGGTATLYYEKCGIFEGVITLEDFEKYCGGTPSPNPSFPQAIENTFDCVEMIQGYYKGDTGVYTASSNYVCSKHNIPCKGGDTVKVECENAEKIYIAGYKEDGTLSTYQTMGVDGVKISSGVTNFAFNVNNSNGITPQTVGKITLTVNGKYVGQIVEHGKNLWNEEWEVGALNYKTGENYSTTNSIRSKGYNTVEPNTEYYINNNVVSIYEYRSDMSYIKNTVTPNTFTTTTDTKYIRLEFISTYGSVYKNDICITKEPDDTYEPYTEKVTTFFLNEPLREGDRLVKVDGVWCEERNRVSIVLDGNSNIRGLYKIDDNRMSFFTILPNYKKPANVSETNYICTKLISIPNNISWAKHSNWISNSDTKIYICPDDMGVVTTTEAAQAWLSENPLTVEYELATPTLTPLDAESQIALNSLVTFDTITYLEVDSKVKASGITTQYAASDVSAVALKAERELAELEDVVAKVESDVADINSRITYVDVDITGTGKTMHKLTLPDGFTIDNSKVVSCEHIMSDETLVNAVKYTDGAGTVGRSPIWLQKNTSVGTYVWWPTQIGANLTFAGTLRVYLQRIS